MDGGAGAVGHFAIELAKRAGARVVTTVSGTDKAALAEKAGADLVVNYRSPDAAEQIRSFGSVDRVIAEWGGVDLLVNNAVDTGPGSMVPLMELGVDQLEAKLAANVVAQFVLIQAVLPGMLERGSGTIVDVTSHTATADPPGPATSAPA